MQEIRTKSITWLGSRQKITNVFFRKRPQIYTKYLVMRYFFNENFIYLSPWLVSGLKNVAYISLVYTKSRHKIVGCIFVFFSLSISDHFRRPHKHTTQPTLEIGAYLDRTENLWYRPILL
uniref:Uncharacterized protein n=1 Tax=Cacopsylla melanoneura TaxID=428564 RepID=A0A8D8WU68_9HEMI